MSAKFPKGAEWRKWDLHFHSPSSYDYKDKSKTNADIIDELSKNNVSLVAITDHHFIDVTRIIELTNLAKAKDITILPGIELRSELGGSESIHFIGIFPEYCKLDEIWTDLQSHCGLKPSQVAEKGNDKVYVDFKETATLIHNLGGIVTIHAGSKSNSVENITNSLSYKQAIKTDIVNFVDIYELGKEDDQIGYKENVFPVIGQTIPVIICSDNHDIKDYQIKQNCWIKADPTFEGLKQVLNEPEDRVFIGEKPEIFARVQKNRTRYIKELKINSVKGYDRKQGKWFENITIPFNQELVAIIGHKGSGKSALTDIISLCSNYHDNDDFSFLTTKKFREKNGVIAKKFQAKLIWESGHSDEIVLNDDPDEASIKGVKYIPQGQFERLTNETSSATEFQREIEKVVFSHIDKSEKLDAYSFDELIEKKKNTIEVQLQGLFEEIEQLNNSIIKLERKEIPSYRKDIENRLKLKEDELKALVEPPVVSNPNDDPVKKKKNEVIIAKINKINEVLDKLENDLDSKQKEKSEALIAIKNLDDTKKEIELKINDFDQFISSKKDILSSFNVDIEKLVFIQKDFSLLDQLITEYEAKLKHIKIILGEEIIDQGNKSLSILIEEKQAELTVEQNKLDYDQKKYQDYLKSKKIWENEKNQIIGHVNAPGTIEFYKNEKKYLDNELKNDLAEFYKNRKSVVRKIFKLRQEVIAIYKDVKSKLNEIIENNTETLKNYKIELAATLVKKSRFNSDFLSFINQRNAGTFYSKEGAEKKLNDLTSEINFDNEDSVMGFLDSILDALRFDKREKQENASRVIEEQINNIFDFYNYLFKLDFIDYNYQLKQGGKGVDQLSPGERGALLLVFYLLLDKDDIPLIIDQPEDNLDNHSVAKILVPFIRSAKSKRQIIMVTHNPNLAVVSDAEQIIYVNLDKEQNYEFSTLTGSIEDKNVNSKIVEVLEGAMPAFNKRRHKYYE